MKARQILILLSAFWKTSCWGFSPSSKKKLYSSATSASSKIRIAALIRDEEPAGVEQIFTGAKNMRHHVIPLDRLILSQKKRMAKAGLIRKSNNNKNNNWHRNNGRNKRRTNHYKEDLSFMMDKVSSSLPSDWEFHGPKELEALAEMKLILRSDFDSIENTSFCLPDDDDDGDGSRVVRPYNDFPDVYGDIRLLRFLRKSRGGQDPVEAALSYRKFLKWRRDNNIDQIRARVESNNKPFQVPSTSAVVSDLLPCEFKVGGTTNFQNTILLHLGEWRTTTLSRMVRKKQDLSMSDFLLYWVYMFESVHMRLDSESVKQRKMVFVDAIADLSGFSLQQLSPTFVSTILTPWVKQLQSNYPETAKRIDVIHPPRVVSLLWKLLTPLLSPGTVAKIRIRG